MLTDWFSNILYQVSTSIKLDMYHLLTAKENRIQTKLSLYY